jgi:hypothetical protein
LCCAGILCRRYVFFFFAAVTAAGEGIVVAFRGRKLDAISSPLLEFTRSF